VRIPGARFARLRSAALAAAVISGLLAMPLAAGTGTGAALSTSGAFAASGMSASISGPGASTVRAGWSLHAAATVPSAHADQGVAVLLHPGSASTVVTRGGSDIPAALRAAGWVHIGDPGASGAYLIDAYQGRSGAHAKMFAVTAPGGARSLLIHRLDVGELYNNSFAAVSPDGHWLVSGEWGAMQRLLVFRLPSLTVHMRATYMLPLATTVALSRPMRDVQGCAFDTAVTLVCASNDPSTDLYPHSRQLLAVSLSRALDGAPDDGVPSYLAAVPELSQCTGGGETEGVDITRGILRVMIVEPGACRAWTAEYSYSRSRV
jgi:hypothetical protein